MLTFYHRNYLSAHMQKQILSVILLLSLVLFSCIAKIDNRDYIIKEKDLIPEGTAVDNRTGTIYIGSTYKRKIIQIESDGKVTDFIPQELDGIWSIVGMEVDEKEDLLWVNTAHANEVMPLINPILNDDWMTTIFYSTHDILQKKY